MLQGRLFSYVDTHRHRLGANYAQIPVNCPLRSIRMGTYNRGGPMNVDTTHVCKYVMGFMETYLLVIKL